MASCARAFNRGNANRERLAIGEYWNVTKAARSALCLPPLLIGLIYRDDSVLWSATNAKESLSTTSIYIQPRTMMRGDMLAYERLKHLDAVTECADSRLSAFKQR